MTIFWNCSFKFNCSFADDNLLNCPFKFKWSFADAFLEDFHSLDDLDVSRSPSWKTSSLSSVTSAWQNIHNHNRKETVSRDFLIHFSLTQLS